MLTLSETNVAIAAAEKWWSGTDPNAWIVVDGKSNPISDQTFVDQFLSDPDTVIA